MVGRLQFNPRNALRPVDWRWQRARLAASGEMPLHRQRDDQHVKVAAQFIREYTAVQADCDLELLEFRYPDTYWAHHYWSQGDLVKNPHGRAIASRYELEARILAESTPEEIEEKTGIGAQDVIKYERLFFDVRPRLSQEGWVFNQVIGPAIQRGLLSREYDTLWKLFGYYYGSQVLDQWMCTCEGARRKVSRDATYETLIKVHRADVLRQAVTAGKTWVLNNETQGQIITLFNQAVELEQKSLGGAAGSNSSIAANVLAGLEVLDFVDGRNRSRKAQLALLDDGNYEPAGARLVDCAVGTVIEIDDDAVGLQFPAPGERGQKP